MEVKDFAALQHKQNMAQGCRSVKPAQIKILQCGTISSALRKYQLKY
jgi:hypothetical protein